MAQIGRQPDHLARRVFAGAIPADHRLDREAMAKIVDARSPAMLAVWLRSPKPDLLAGSREVVSGRAVGEPRCLVGDEQRLARMADQPVAPETRSCQVSRLAVTNNACKLNTLFKMEDGSKSNAGGAGFNYLDKSSF